MHSSPFVLSSRFFIPPKVVDETGLGGWWLSLNDPVHFEKESIRGLGFSQKPLKRHIRTCMMNESEWDVSVETLQPYEI